MKKFFFVVVLAAFSALLVIASVSGRDAQAEKDPLAEIGISFSGGKEVLSLSSSGTTAPFDKKTGDGIQMRMVWPGDHVLALQSDLSTMNVEPNGESMKITVWNGLFYFSLDDLRKTYEIDVPGAHIRPIAKWGFFVDSREWLRIYSVSALLDTELVNATASVTHVNVFPFMLLLHSSEFDTELTGADTFRVAQIDTFRSADIMTEAGPKVAFGTDYEKPLAMLAAERAFIKERDKKLSKLFERITSQKTAEDLNILDKYGMVFFNEEKKRILLKNGIIRSLGEIVRLETTPCTNNCKSSSMAKNHISNIERYLGQLSEISIQDEKEWKGIINRYATLLQMYFVQKGSDYFKEGQSPIAELVNRVNPVGSKKENQYRPLTELYASYALHGGKREDLDRNVDVYIQSLINRNTIDEKDFPSFVFFLKEYLALSSDTIESDSLMLFRSTLSIAKNYIESLKEEEKRFSALSVLYFTFNTALNRTHDGLKQTYFDTVTPEYLLKEQFKSGEEVKLDPNFMENLKVFLEDVERFSKEYSEFYASKLQSADNSIDNLSVLVGSIWLFKQTYDVMANYTSYRMNLALSESSRNATGLVINTEELSQEKLNEYMKKFEEVDFSTLKITNDFKKDGYYDVSVTISQKPFTFRLEEPGNILKQVKFERGGEWVTLFENIAVNLDDREKFMKERMGGITDPEQRRNYDFASYFRTAFLESPAPKETASTSTPNPSRPAMTSEMQVFVEQELIQKDFRNIADFAPIGIANVFAETKDGMYDVKLSDIWITLNSQSRSYRLVLEGKYRFTSTEHAFENLSFKLLKDGYGKIYEFSGIAIQVLPDTINLVDFESSMKTLPEYLNAIYNLPTPPTSSIRIDLAAKSYVVDGNTYTLN